jgi:hypothetical protein
MIFTYHWKIRAFSHLAGLKAAEVVGTVEGIETPPLFCGLPLSLIGC